MLVLSRKPGERILIGDNVVITVIRIGSSAVRLGIEAPRDVKIVREELEELKGTPITDLRSQISEYVEVEIDLDLDAVGELLTGVLDTVREPIVDSRSLEMPARPQRGVLKKRVKAAHLRELVRL